VPAFGKLHRFWDWIGSAIAKEDFNDDQKDAGELGAGHTVTALYEIVPKGKSFAGKNVDALKYQKTEVTEKAVSNDLLTIKLRYKPIKSETSKLLSDIITLNNIKGNPSDDFRFSAAIAEFGMLLRNSEHKGNASVQNIIRLVGKTEAKEISTEFLKLVNIADNLWKNKD